MKPGLFLTVVALAAAIIATATVSAQTPLSEDALMTAAGALSVYPINHATLVLKWREVTVYVDPVGGEDRFAGFPAPDLILITHIHGDHTDVETLKAVSSTQTEIVAPETVASELDRFRTLVGVNDSIEVRLLKWY